jgi:hypothetical protein
MQVDTDAVFWLFELMMVVKTTVVLSKAACGSKAMNHHPPDLNLPNS